MQVLCDGGNRSLSKLYNEAFLKEKGLSPTYRGGESVDFIV
jgi:hypothetical protein